MKSNKVVGYVIYCTEDGSGWNVIANVYASYEFAKYYADWLVKSKKIKEYEVLSVAEVEEGGEE